MFYGVGRIRLDSSPSFQPALVTIPFLYQIIPIPSCRPIILVLATVDHRHDLSCGLSTFGLGTLRLAGLFTFLVSTVSKRRRVLQVAIQIDLVSRVVPLHSPRAREARACSVYTHIQDGDVLRILCTFSNSLPCTLVPQWRQSSHEVLAIARPQCHFL